MPNKSRRVASRQAELGSKKRKSTRKPSVAAITEANNTVQHNIENNEESNAKVYQQQGFIKKDTATVISESSRNIASTASARVANPYIWGEMKRIGITTLFIMTILAVLTVTLR